MLFDVVCLLSSFAPLKESLEYAHDIGSLAPQGAPHSQATFGVVGVHQPLGTVEKPLVAQALGLLAEAVQQFPQGTRAAGSS